MADSISSLFDDTSVSDNTTTVTLDSGVTVTSPNPGTARIPWHRTDKWYISSSSLALWEKSPEEWVMKYVVGIKQSQTLPMAVGTVFDAMIKAKFEALFCGGLGEDDYEKYLLSSLQIYGEERETAILAGRETYVRYLKSGNYDTLVRCIRAGQWAVELVGNITVKLPFGPNGEMVNVNLRPDMILHKLASDGTCKGIVQDWKVNGFMAGAGASVHGGWAERCSIPPDKKAVNRGRAELLLPFEGINYNVSDMELMKEEWAIQLGLYGLGWGWEKCEWLAWIEQIAWGPQNPNLADRPMRVGSHRYKLSETFKSKLRTRVWKMWEAIALEDRPLKYAGYPSHSIELERMALLTSTTQTAIPSNNGSITLSSGGTALEELFR